MQTEEEFDALVSQIEFDFAKMVDDDAAIIEMKMGASRYQDCCIRTDMSNQPWWSNTGHACLSSSNRRLVVRYNKPRYVGVTILAYAKHKLFEFHYEKVLPLFPDPAKQVRVLMCDTGRE